MAKEEKKKGPHISGSSAKTVQGGKKKKTKDSPAGPKPKAELWLSALFYDFLYYRSEESPYSLAKKNAKVKLPRSRHK